MLKHDHLIQSKLVETGWRFGQVYGGGHLPGQMVMSALANRVRKGWGSWLHVLQGVPDFMAENEMPPLVYPINVWDSNFVKLLHAVEGIYDGSAQDLTKGALFFADLTKIERGWFQEHIISAMDFGMNAELRLHPIVSNMNSLTFFK